MNTPSKHPFYPGWRKYHGPHPDVPTLQTEIIDLLGRLRPMSDEDDKVEGGFTNLIKFELLMLGYSKGYCGYANLRKESTRAPTPDDELPSNTDDYVKRQAKKINDHIDTLRSKFNFEKHTFCSTEWLYDIHFYRDKPGTHYMPEYLYMAGEIELWGKRKVKEGQTEHSGLPYSEVCYDFQKLLATNAQLRVMICRLKNEDILHDPQKGLTAYFDNAIRHYNQLQAGDQFLLACYIKRELHYAFVSKPPRIT